jgi:hypothetical protein
LRKFAPLPPLAVKFTPFGNKETDMGINSERNVTANLQIGPTSLGNVRLYIEADGVEVPMDFTPDEALEIAEEIRAAALTITGEK